MPVFAYSARTVGGELKQDEIELPTRDEVIKYLRKRRLIPVTVRVKPKEIKLGMKRKVKTREMVILTRQFATMINAGLPLVKALQILAEQVSNPTIQAAIEKVVHDVESGDTLAHALKEHPKLFSPLYVNMVDAGEAGGILDTILLRLATFLEKADALARKVKGAMVYPGTVLVVAVMVVVLMLVKIIPTFEKMFADFGGELPAPTKMVIAMSNWMQDWVFVLGAVVVGGTVAFQQARRRSYKFRKATDAAFLKAPVFGSLLRKVAVARFTRTLGTMIASGVPILDGLDIVSRTAGNVVVEEALLDVKRAISEGKTIAEPLAESDVFPSMVVQMIAVGEQTGAMETMLSKIADFYDDEVDAAVDALTAMLEPAMMVGLGGTVGSLLVAMYLPIFKIAETIG
jgi:type IV pilus assembly protein PilC